MFLNYLYLTITSMSYLSINYEKDCYYYSIILLTYCLLTLLNNKWDAQLHHLLVIFLMIFQLFFLQDCSKFESYLKMIKIGFKVQYSSIFYTLNFIIPKNWEIMKAINSIIFMITFFYYRIYLMFTILNNDQYHSIVLECSNSNIKRWILYNLYLSLYILNIYWGILILNKFYKKYIKNYLTKLNND